MPSNSTRSIRAGSVFVEFFGKDGKLMETTKRVSQHLRTFGSAIALSGVKVFGAGETVLAPLKIAAFAFAKMGSDVADASQRTGIAAEQLSTLGYAAKQSGAEMDDLVRGVGKMQQHLADATTGSESAQKAFTDLGLSVESLAGMSPDEQFRTIAGAISEVGDPAQRASAAMDIFGKSGMQLMPMLREGRSGLKAMEDRARDLGLVMSGESVSAADRLGDLFDDIWSQAKKLTYEIGSALAPAITSASETISRIASVAIGWIQNNRGVVLSVAAVGAAVAGTGAAMIGIGGVISAIGFGLGGLASAVSLVGRTVTGLFSAISLALSPLKIMSSVVSGIGVILSAVLSPAGLVIAAIAGLAYWSGAGGKALNWLREQFGPLYDTASQVIGAISNAMSAGNWEAAGNAAWAGLKLAWIQGSQIVQGIWRDFSTSLKNTFMGTVDVIANVWSQMIGRMESALAKAQNRIASWIIDSQAFFGAMSEAEAAAAQGELVAMGQQRQDQIRRDLLASSQGVQDKADQREAESRAANAKAIADARAALQKAREEADAAIKAAMNAKPEIKPGSAMSKLQNTDWEATLNNAAMQVKSPGASGGAGGTFSRLANQMFGGGDDPIKIAKQHLKVSQQMLDKIEQAATRAERQAMQGIVYS